MKKFFGICSAVAVTALIAFASPTQADVMFFDVNQLTAQHTGIALGYTGNLTLSSGTATVLQDYRVFDDIGNDVGPSSLAGGFVSATMDVSFVGGFVTGGTIALSYDNGDSTTTTYQADITPHSLSGVGEIEIDSFVLGTLVFSVDTNSGSFTNNQIGGFDISAWFNAQGIGSNLLGNVISFAIRPTANTADMDVLVLTVIPTPSSGLISIVSIAGLQMFRARRRTAV